MSSVCNPCHAVASIAHSYAKSASRSVRTVVDVALLQQLCHRGDCFDAVSIAKWHRHSAVETAMQICQLTAPQVRRQHSQRDVCYKITRVAPVFASDFAGLSWPRCSCGSVSTATTAEACRHLRRSARVLVRQVRRRLRRARQCTWPTKRLRDRVPRPGGGVRLHQFCCKRRSGQQRPRPKLAFWRRSHHVRSRVKHASQHCAQVVHLATFRRLDGNDIGYVLDAAMELVRSLDVQCMSTSHHFTVRFSRRAHMLVGLCFVLYTHGGGVKWVFWVLVSCVRTPCTACARAVGITRKSTPLCTSKSTLVAFARHHHVSRSRKQPHSTAKSPQRAARCQLSRRGSSASPSPA